jgi:hypothetical protein
MKQYHLKKTAILDPTRRQLRGRKRLQLFVITLLCSGLLFSCAQIRKVTYPDDYVYLEQKEITSEMVLLSFYMRKIDEILLEDDTISSEQQARIEDILVSMSASLDSLGTGNVQTSHLVIDEHIDQFQADVNRALYNVRADPPNYFALGQLSGSCAACHQYREF